MSHPAHDGMPEMPPEFCVSGLFCLALAVYFEARGEQIPDGQLAVAHTVMNRVESDQFPNTICEVVKQGKYRGTLPLRNQCAFSFWCDGKPEHIRNQGAWAQAWGISALVMLGLSDDPTDGSTHYHASYVSPGWADRDQFITEIGNHLFYRLQ